MTLRTYTRLRSVSAKRQRQQPTDAQVRREVMERAQYRCEVTITALDVEIRDGKVRTVDDQRGFVLGRCPRRAVEVHHVVKRSQGGAMDPDNGMAICRACHERCDYPFSRGRLVPTALGGGRFQCVVRYASDKWTARPQ